MDAAIAVHASTYLQSWLAPKSLQQYLLDLGFRNDVVMKALEYPYPDLVVDYKRCDVVFNPESRNHFSRYFVLGSTPGFHR